MWIVLALALVVGLLLGLMGGGGSILMVALLTYVAGLEPKQDIAGSLFVVGVTSLVSVLLHSRHGTVRWRTGLIFGAASMVGALLGGVVGGFLPGTLLLIAFAVMMLFTAWAMIRPKKTQPAAAPSVEASADVEPRRHPLGKILLEGVVVGFVPGGVVERQGQQHQARAPHQQQHREHPESRPETDGPCRRYSRPAARRRAKG